MSSHPDEGCSELFPIISLPSSPTHSEMDDFTNDTDDTPTAAGRSLKHVGARVASIAIVEATKRDRHASEDDSCAAAGKMADDKPVKKKSRGVVLCDETDGNMLLRVDNCQGKGRAVFSQKAIKKGARIVLDGVLWWIKLESAKDQKCNYEQQYVSFLEKYCTPESMRDGTMAKVIRNIHLLQNSITQRRQTNADKFRHIFEINGWTHKKGTVVAVAFGSLINHSCVPDFKVDFDLRQNRMLLTAKNAVEKIREVTVSYLSKTMLNRSVDQRQEALACWGFYCQCPKCRTETALHRKNAASKELSADIMHRLAIIELDHTRRCQQNNEYQDCDEEPEDSDADTDSDEERFGMASGMSSVVKRGRRVKNARMQGRMQRDGHDSSNGSSSSDSDDNSGDMNAAQQRALSVTPPLPVSCRITHRFASFSSTMPGAQNMRNLLTQHHKHNAVSLPMPAPRIPTISRLRQRLQPKVPKPHLPHLALQYASSSGNMPAFLHDDAVVRWQAQRDQENTHNTRMQQTREEMHAQIAQDAWHAQYTPAHFNANGGGF